MPFLDLRNSASTRGSTVRGLLGMTFHPKYVENGYFFVHYTQGGGDSVIARYQVSANPNLADPNSETRLLEISYPIGEHAGGGLAFGPDGYLYISIGDGGAGGNGDEAGNAQNPETYLGTLLRMDVDNDAEPEVWATGLRNPWRFSFDALNGDLYIADVGENQWEEINFLPAGSLAGVNFGWNFYEGDQPYQGNPPESLETIFPVWVYDHSLGAPSPGAMSIAENQSQRGSESIFTAITAPAISGACCKIPMEAGRMRCCTNYPPTSLRSGRMKPGRFIW